MKDAGSSSISCGACRQCTRPSWMCERSWRYPRRCRFPYSRRSGRSDDGGCGGRERKQPGVRKERCAQMMVWSHGVDDGCRGVDRRCRNQQAADTIDINYTPQRAPQTRAIASHLRRESGLRPSRDESRVGSLRACRLEIQVHGIQPRNLTESFRPSSILRLRTARRAVDITALCKVSVEKKSASVIRV